MNSGTEPHIELSIFSPHGLLLEEAMAVHQKRLGFQAAGPSARHSYACQLQAIVTLKN